MVATLLVYTDFGGIVDAPATKQNADASGPPQLRFKYADNNTIDTADPLPIPPTGTTRSRWKHIYLKVSLPPDTQINNMKVYTDGVGFGTGITVLSGNETPINTLAGDGGYDPSDVADEVLTNHVDITATTNFFTYTSGSPKTISISEVGNILNAIDQETDYLVLQMEVINTASPGDLVNETITYEYDEI